MFNMVFILVREKCSNVVHDLFDIDIMSLNLYSPCDCVFVLISLVYPPSFFVNYSCI